MINASNYANVSKTTQNFPSTLMPLSCWLRPSIWGEARLLPSSGISRPSWPIRGKAYLGDVLRLFAKLRMLWNIRLIIMRPNWAGLSYAISAKSSGHYTRRNNLKTHSPTACPCSSSPPGGLRSFSNTWDSRKTLYIQVQSPTSKF